VPEVVAVPLETHALALLLQNSVTGPGNAGLPGSETVFPLSIAFTGAPIAPVPEIGT
jgi:hypothetical protein